MSAIDWRDAPHGCGITHPSSTDCLRAALILADCPIGYREMEWVAALKLLARHVAEREEPTLTPG